MKHILLSTIAAVVLVGCGTIRQSTEAPDAKQEFKSSVSPDDSGTYTLTNSYTGDALTIELKTDGSFLIPPVGSSDKLIGSWKAENELLILEGATEKSSEAIKIKFNKTTGKVVFGSGKQGELQKEELDRFTVKKHEVNKGEELKTIHISIHKATELGNIETVKQHLAANTDVNEEHAEYGGNPLHTCATFGSKEIAELLIEKGANVNSKDQYGGNPLHTSAMFGQLEIAELLIEKGANVNAKTNEGETPLDFARQDFGDGPPTPKMVAVKKETATLLRKHGGKTGEELKAEGK